MNTWVASTNHCHNFSLSLHQAWFFHNHIPITYRGNFSSIQEIVCVPQSCVIMSPKACLKPCFPLPVIDWMQFGPYVGQNDLKRFHQISCNSIRCVLRGCGITNTTSHTIRNQIVSILNIGHVENSHTIQWQMNRADWTCCWWKLNWVLEITTAIMIEMVYKTIFLGLP